jgi:hypothetical protein
MAARHMSARDAVRAAHVLGAATSIAIHFGTFRQGDDGQREPLDSLAAALATEPEPAPRFWALANGEARDVPGLRHSGLGTRHSIGARHDSPGTPRPDAADGASAESPAPSP